MIVVSSLHSVEAAFDKHRPAYVVSVLDKNEPTPPVFSSIAPENHVRLIGDCSRACPQEGERSRCQQLIDLANRWLEEKAPRPAILIHCCEGAARSMAVAYILICAIEKSHCEKEIAQRLRLAAPHADPNLMLVSEADALLGREERMVEAILDLCPCSGTVDAPIITLPVAA